MRHIQGVGLGLFIAVAVVALAAFGTTLAQDAAPSPRSPFEESFTYQGRLEIDGVPANGSHTIVIELWDAPAGGSLLTSNSQQLEVTNGIFSMTVAVAGFLDGERRWLQALVAAVPSNIPLGARQELTPVAYAIFAKEAGSLSSEAAAGFIQNGTDLQPSSNFHISGNGVADGALDASKLQINGEDFAYVFGTSNSGLAIGIAAGNGPTSTMNNTFVGFVSGNDLTTGNHNSGFGARALSRVATGESNTAVGRDALNKLFSGSQNTVVGESANYDNVSGDNNVVIGFHAGVRGTASDNTFVGAFAGRGFTTGQSNVFIGRSAGEGNLGQSAGEQNVAVGTSAGLVLKNGFLNTLVGDHAGPEVTDGLANTVLGWAAGNDLTTGDSNTLVGGLAGDNLIAGNSNTALGYLSGFSGASPSFATTIGAGAVATSSNQVQLGRSGSDTVRIGRLLSGGPALPLCHNGQVLADCSSSQRYKTNLASYTGGLDVLEQLRPVTFDWKEDGSHDLGFVAEEVEAADPLLVTYKNGQVEGVKYDRISAVLVNSVMEQQAQIDALSAGVAPETGNAIEERLTALESDSDQPWLLLAGVVIAALVAGAAGGFVAGKARRT